MFKDAIPGVHHACRESQTECNYRSSAGAGIKGPIINWDKDLLYIPDLRTLCIINEWLCWSSKEGDLLKSVVLDLSVASMVFGPFSRYLAFEFMEQTRDFLFPNLESITILIRPGPAGASIDDFWDASKNNPSVIQVRVDYVLAKIRTLQPAERWKNIDISVVRNETWKR
jgi:hypothetical protein